MPFNRIRHAVHVLSSRVEPEAEREQGLHRYGDDLAMLQVGDAKQELNPALRLIEVYVLAWIGLNVATPAFRWLLEPAQKAEVYLTIFATFGLYWLANYVQDRITGALGSLLRLEFLDPYVGRRLKRTIAVLRS